MGPTCLRLCRLPLLYASSWVKLTVLLIVVLIVLSCASLNTREFFAMRPQVGYLAQATPGLGEVRVNTGVDFEDRVYQLNVELRAVRASMLKRRGGGEWRDAGQREATYVVSGPHDNITELLVTRFPQVTAVVLPWRSNVSENSVWNSLADTQNVLLRRYYAWTADDTLCSWIETRDVTRMKYDAFFNFTCSRNMADSVKPISLSPVYLNVKPFMPPHFWPNSGNSCPPVSRRVLRKAPKFVYYVHVFHDALVTADGDVFSGNLKFVPYTCSSDLSAIRPQVRNLSWSMHELFVVSQEWGTSVFHRMVEVVPRLAMCLDFLRKHPQIRILAPESAGGRLGELLKILGLDASRLVSGAARAKLVYLPRATGCGSANVQESQVLAKLYRDYIERTFPTRRRDRVILIRRSGVSRRFAEWNGIEEVVERAARDFGLTYTLFADNPTPSLNDTMMMFHSAVIVVGPHGAALSNLLFSRPGTYVVEGVCQLPRVILCFQRLAHVLGHHWHGVTSRGGCDTVVDVSTHAVQTAVRSYLLQWRQQQNIARFDKVARAA